jgi:tetratricopeptide (TPR) repeat protein
VLEDLTLDGQDVRRQRALALQVLGEIELQLGNCQNGKEPLGQSLSLYRALGDRRSIAYCLRSLGRLVERMGNYDDAVQLHQESVEICRALGAQRDTVEALLDLFVDLQFLGRYQESERLLWESLAIAQQLEDRAALTEVRYRLAMFLKDSKPTESLALLEECVAVYAELGDRHRWALALMRLGEAKMYLGQYDPAHAALEESLAWYREVDNRWGIGAALWLLAELAQVEGQHEAAWQFSQESVIAFRRSGARADVGMALVGLGMAAAGSGDLGQARHNLADALRVALKYRHDFASTHVLVGAALLAAEERNGARAVELWALASQAPMIAASRIYQDLYGKRIAAIAETLPPDVVAAAEERGRARDMWAALEELLAELGG